MTQIQLDGRLNLTASAFNQLGQHKTAVLIAGHYAELAVLGVLVLMLYPASSRVFC